MRNPQYLVIYKDSAKAKQRFFGPFVQPSIADNFASRLPSPLEGGHKIIKHTEPQTYDEATRVAFQLVAERTPLNM